MPRRPDINHTVDWTVTTFDSALPKLTYPEGMRIAREQGLIRPGHWEKLGNERIRQVLDQVGFMADLNGFTYLEIGAGQNDIAATLRGRGARVTAVDPEYANPQKLDQRVSDWVAQHDNNVPQEVLDELSRGRQRFRDDFQKHRGDYIAAFSTNLSSVPDGSVDLALSHFCISPVVSPRSKDLVRSLEQLIRKLKPGVGVAKIYPFDHLEDEFEGDFEAATNHALSLEEGRRYLDQIVPGGWQEYTWAEELPRPLNERKLLVIRRPTA